MMYGWFNNYSMMPFGFSDGVLSFVVLAAIWDLVWKGLGLWRAAQRRESGWFVAILLINTLGILPLLYLYVFSKPVGEKPAKSDK